MNGRWVVLIKKVHLIQTKKALKTLLTENEIEKYLKMLSKIILINNFFKKSGC